jgi:hypothetical protein
MILTNPFVIPAIVALLVAIVVVSAHARRRAMQYNVSDRDIDFMCRLAEKHGWGKDKKYYAQKRGTDIVFVFGPYDSATEEERAQVLRILPHHQNDPIVFLYTIYRDQVRYNPDGSKKQIGKDARTFQKFNDDY